MTTAFDARKEELAEHLRKAVIVQRTRDSVVMLRDELERARKKFPQGLHLVPALMEEIGELARELLQKGNTEHARKEAIQVACVAMRIASEGCPEFDNLDDEARQL